MSAPPLNYFLDIAKEALHDARDTRQQLTLVFGKDEPDLDSIAAAVIFAYFRTACPPDNGWSPCYIPILNERRSALADHPLLMRVLPHASIALDTLITVEDMVRRGTQSGILENLVKFFLVDHNLTLGREKQDYSLKVVGCIDHSMDEHYVPEFTDPEPRIITPAGSCTSLVVNFSRKSWESLDFYVEGSELALAKLALAAILVDTRNMTTDVTEEDIVAVEFLLSRIRLSKYGRDFDQTDYYYEIIGERRPRPAEQIVQEQPRHIDVPMPVPAPVEPIVEADPEPQPTTDPEPVTEVQPDVVPEVEHIPEPLPEPVPVFVNTSPVVQALPEVEDEPIAELQPVITSPVSPSGRVRPRFPYVYLDEVLAHDFEQGYEGDGAIGISFTPMGLSEMVLHAERDVIERANKEDTNGENTATDQITNASPFTAAVRDFALSRGLSVYAIRTNIRKGNELFVWVFSPFMGYFIPRFVQNRAKQLGLERWGTDEDVITKEAFLNEGMMAAYWMKSDPGRDGVKRAIMEGTTYIFFGNGSAPAPTPPPRPPPRKKTGNSFIAAK